jgi:hypothetical protein
LFAKATEGADLPKNPNAKKRKKEVAHNIHDRFIFFPLLGYKEYMIITKNVIELISGTMVWIFILSMSLIQKIHLKPYLTCRNS